MNKCKLLILLLYLNFYIFDSIKVYIKNCIVHRVIQTRRIKRNLKAN
jgi:hypothetical protein